ncbi:prepilin-type N-terminal cleavage/methylation domain-containing protein [Carnobacterium iners]|uniref:Prepilin-type N-terminal cleavage/methylation domain-containing protein n=1 Tax=Carnobacterium iners TaxID=1073423 RepID=A0A1X7NC71_9LACT|nr:prepilin-type N-terminal cleavage/methylation domain-containing protein [Carnobacterium iners]SEK50673.1 prepilin-type N-terminal cleavage/methylation domain-containing protein [Carnobacterium iners]SMH34359.1 prepilin-type N-terminal cleavage/methylation domain-containing protein [Carnobacterium iners]
MHKWKRGYHSVQQNRTKINLRNESGMTLIELLASIALLSVVLALAGAVNMFGQRQYMTQSYSASQSNNYAYTLSVISREIRKHPYASITVSELGDTLLIDKVEFFSKKGSQLFKNGNQILAEDVGSFVVSSDSETESIKILLKSISEKNNQPKEYQTTIYLRE